MTLSSIIFGLWRVILPGMLILEIALFILSLLRNRYLIAQLPVGILGAVYALLAMGYTEDKSILFGDLETALVLYLAIPVFIVLTIVFGVAFAIVHARRR